MSQYSEILAFQSLFGKTDLDNLIPISLQFLVETFSCEQILLCLSEGIHQHTIHDSTGQLDHPGLSTVVGEAIKNPNDTALISKLFNSENIHGRIVSLSHGEHTLGFLAFGWSPGHAPPSGSEQELLELLVDMCSRSMGPPEHATLGPKC